MEQWSNNACLGYVISGLRKLGKKPSEIQEIVNAVYGRFDAITVEEAAEIYNDSPY